MLIAACLGMLTLVAAEASPDAACSCSRIAEMEAAFEERIARLEALLKPADKDSAAFTRVSANGAVIEEQGGRRLQASTSAGATVVAVQAWQLHEFPSGHSCDSGKSPAKAYLKPLMPVNGMTAEGYPSSPVPEFSLMSNRDGESRTEIQRVTLPIKVVHDASCSAAPTLSLPLTTRIEGQEASGKDIMSSLRSMGPFADPFAWTVDTAKGTLRSDNIQGRVQRNADGLNYYKVAYTKAPIVAMTWQRGPGGSNFHTLIELAPSSTATYTIRLWFYHGSDNVAHGVRSICSNGEIWHGTDAAGSAGTTNPPDDNYLPDSDANDVYSVTIEGTTVKFWALKYNWGQTPVRTCTIPSGNYVGRVRQESVLVPLVLVHGRRE